MLNSAGGGVVTAVKNLKLNPCSHSPRPHPWNQKLDCSWWDFGLQLKSFMYLTAVTPSPPPASESKSKDANFEQKFSTQWWYMEIGVRSGSRSSCRTTQVVFIQSGSTSYQGHNALQMAHWSQSELHMKFMSSFQVWKIAFTTSEAISMHHQF